MPNTAVILDAEGEVAMIVHPTRESELDDPAFNPLGHVQVRMKRAIYDGCTDKLALLKATVGLVSDAKVVAAVQSKIEAAEVEIALKAEQDRLAAEAALLEPIIP